MRNPWARPSAPMFTLKHEPIGISRSKRSLGSSMGTHDAASSDPGGGRTSSSRSWATQPSRSSIPWWALVVARARYSSACSRSPFSYAFLAAFKFSQILIAQSTRSCESRKRVSSCSPAARNWLTSAIASSSAPSNSATTSSASPSRSLSASARLDWRPNNPRINVGHSLRSDGTQNHATRWRGGDPHRKPPSSIRSYSPQNRARELPRWHDLPRPPDGERPRRHGSSRARRGNPTPTTPSESVNVPCRS